MLAEKQDDGNSLRVHLECVYAQTGFLPEQLAAQPSLPQLVSHIWVWFLDMCCDRVSGMEAGRLTATIMKDWCWATGNELELWERKAIRQVDEAWFRTQSK